jgi:Holliday junction resolvase
MSIKRCANPLSWKYLTAKSSSRFPTLLIYLNPKQLNHILEISKNAGATPVLAVRRRHRSIRWFKMTEQGAEETGLKELEQGS